MRSRTRCFSWPLAATAVSRTTAVDTSVPANRGRAMTWTFTAMTWLSWSTSSKPARREGLRRRAQFILAPGNDGRLSRVLLLHQGVFGNGPDGRSEKNRCADPDLARRRRPDRPDKRVRNEIFEAHEKRHAENL